MAQALRFHLPLIGPDVRVSHMRLSDNVHASACGGAAGIPSLRDSPFPSIDPIYKMNRGG